MFEVKHSYSHGSTHFSGQYLLRFFSFLLFSFAFLLPHTAQADGVSWLETQVNADGSYANALDVSFPAQSTAEVLRTYHLLSQELQPGVIAARTFISTQGDEKTEILSRKIIALAEAGGDTSALVAKLLLLQNRDGGFGDQEGYQSRVVDTAFALNALGIAQSTGASDAVGSAVSYLLREQSPDGGFSHSSVNNSSVYETALASIALQKYVLTYNVSNVIALANDYLIQAQSVSGGWGSYWETAQALLAVIPITIDATRYIDSVVNLRNGQLQNGSWDDDVYTTGLSLRALYLADNIITPKDPTLGSLAGTVIETSTGNPIAGVAVSLGVGNANITTGTDGKFILLNIPPANYTVSYSSAGYTGATQTLNTVAGQLLNVGTIRLSKLPSNPNFSSLFGKVVDSTSGLALSGVKISLGSGNAEVQTSADGKFNLTDISPNTYTATYSIAGYSVATQSITTQAGQVINAGTIQLSPLPNVGVITGVITDADTRQPLAGVVVQITGSGNGTATTGVDGSFGLSVQPGDINISVSLAGYNSVDATTTLVAGSRVNFSPALSLVGTTPNGPDVSLFGQVIGLDTGQPLTGAQISIIGQVVSGISDANGNFDLTGISAGDIEVELSMPGYQTVRFNAQAPLGSKLNIGVVSLVLEAPVVNQISLSGIVTESGTTNPVAGAKVIIEGTTLSATTGPDGYYDIQGIQQLNFKVLINAGGYISTFQTLSFAEFATLNFDFNLKRASLGGFDIVELKTDLSLYPAYAPVNISAILENLGDAARSVQILTEIINSNGQIIHKPAVGLSLGAGGSGDSITIPSGGSTNIGGLWFTGIEDPGVYQVRTKVFDKFTNQELSQRVATLTIVPTQSISRLKVISTPAFANLGASEQVVLTATISNRSNIGNDLILSYNLLSPDGSVIQTGEITLAISPSESSKVIELANFNHTFDKSGDYPLNVQIINGTIPDELLTVPIRIAPTVRVEPTQGIGTSIIVPDGDKRIKIKIQIQGVQQQ